MSRPSIFIPKFIGSVSLGLLTGLSYTLTTLSLPTLLSLPSLPPALTTFTALRSKTLSHQTILSLISASSLFFAYMLAPRGQKQPYLLWALSTVAVAGKGVDWWIGKGGRGGGIGYDSRGFRREEEEEDFNEDVNGEVNGEVVREEMEAWRRAMMVKGGVWGLGFAMCVVGIWGDGY